jgi:hypothetical protein
MTCIGGVPLSATINLLTIIFKVIVQFYSVQIRDLTLMEESHCSGHSIWVNKLPSCHNNEVTTFLRNRQDLLEVLDLAARGKVKAHCEIRDIDDLNRYVNVILAENRGE